MVLRRRRVRTIRLVLALDAGAGAELLAAGLAFKALFALLSALLLLAALLGLFVADPGVRAAVLDELLTVAPAPLRVSIGDTLAALVEQRDAVGIAGVLGLAWTASGLYGALDAVMARLIPGPRYRTVLARRLRGLAAMAAIGLGLVLVLGLAVGWSIVAAGLGGVGSSVALPLAGAVISVPGIVLATYAAYTWVPTEPPGPRAAALPALAMGGAIALLTNGYAALVPHLVGRLSALGVLAALLGLMLWLGYTGRLLILGASWARVRRDRARAFRPGGRRSGGRSAPSEPAATRS